jgi:KDO2-lipid IV(A) lauroyltransferase
MGIALGHAGFPVSFVAKPFDNPLLDEAINARRRLTGNGYVAKGGARARIQRLLQEGGSVAIVIDQHVAPKDRLWIPFFGMAAPTARSVGTLALDTGAPLVPIHSFPLPGGRCRCEFGPVVDVSRTGNREADAEALVAATVREMERAVRRRPEAWLWMHRRWKVRPTEERGRFPRYSISEVQERQRIEARRRASGGDVAAGPAVLATFPPATPDPGDESIPCTRTNER